MTIMLNYDGYNHLHMSKTLLTNIIEQQRSGVHDFLNTGIKLTTQKLKQRQLNKAGTLNIPHSPGSRIISPTLFIYDANRSTSMFP